MSDGPQDWMASEPFVLTWYTSPDERTRHDERFRASVDWPPAMPAQFGGAHTCVCGTCGATYVTDGESDGPEDLFTHMVRRHVGIPVLSNGRDVVIRKVEAP